MMKKIKRILIYGYFGYGSLGDEVILSGMKNSLLQRYPHCRIVVLSHYPEVVKRLHNLPAIYSLPVGIKGFILWILRGRFWNTLKEILGADLFILGGGGFLSDRDWLNIPRWLINVVYAKLFCLPVMSYALGVGPINTKLGKFLTRIFFNHFNLVTVRDDESKRCLEAAGVKKEVIVTTDPGILIKPDTKAELKDASGKTIPKISEKYKIGLAPAAMFFSEKLWPGKKERYFQLIRDFAAIGDFIYQKLNAEVFLLQVSPNVDTDICQKIQRRMKNKSHLLSLNYSQLEMAGLFAQMDMIVGMRFHSIVLSAAMNIPFVAIIYHYKTAYFLEQINQRHRGVPLDFDLENLFSVVIDTWNKRKEMKKELSLIIPELKKKAEIPAIMADKFLR